MIPLCLDQGVGLTPYSPLAKGRATRPWGEQTARSSADAVAKTFDREADKPVVDAIHKDRRRAWHSDGAGCAGLGAIEAGRVLPILGATRPTHLQDAVAALDVKLTEDDITALEEPYTPQDNYWW